MALIDKRIYLASQSPRRRELLKQIGMSFEVLALRTMTDRSDVVETPLPDEAPTDFVRRMACEKAARGWRAVDQRRLLDFPVLGADTVVDVDERILGKPADRQDAEKMLNSLSGRSHWVHTAVAVQHEDILRHRLSSSRVEFCRLDEKDIRKYLDSGEFIGKAGGYAIQGRIAVFVTRINGSYSGIMGLPLFETQSLLREFGVSPS
jgi:nucleoside triphosphate pyrophosphatase